ncbi:BMP family ABC transporter substrate-binding protein [Paenibacillus sp. ACRRX]|uniref:BMP family lipoprotein n=1 Tax=unclassified Paenibacillus TaxID=185978 RepID=UPI001EF4E638|nr:MULTISPECIES: BMP family ABC transporter substrate-binding protein [unclassified Paenibacillus]MCG7406212.1 BMP family ABC transporter substrate-binding protein [Paenibacillus sp. ACRRX]MDK8179245.1 BMP family ABC transporter substrate-binding protein [Paenibacillus sp. UMB4589-SE434]
MKQTKKFWVLTLVAALFFSVALTGCGGKNKDESGAANGGAHSELKAGLVTDLGSVNDKSFNQSAWEGLQKLNKETGVQVKYLEPKKDTEIITSLNQFVKNKYDLTWATGYTMMDAVKQVAGENPNVKIGLVDAEVQAPNVASVLFKEQEGSFLVGVIAGLTTKSNKVGFVGGVELPVIKRFEVGFRAGVEAVNPEAAKNMKVIYAGDFSRVDKGKSAAATIYNEGADIIFHAAGMTGNGVFNEAKERSKGDKKAWVIGVDMDQSLTFGDEVTLTSMVKKVDEAVVKVSKDMIDGKFPGGKTTYLGLKENGVDIASTSTKNVAPDVLKKVEEFREKIINGEITVPEK